VTEHPRGNFGDIRVGPDSLCFAPSAEEMALMDRLTIESGTSATTLMERAGEELSRVIIGRYPTAHQFLVLCGPGNNGGDGLVIARLLRAAGREVRVVLVASERYSDECLRQMQGHERISVFGSAVKPEVTSSVVLESVSADDVKSLVRNSEVVVDALLGTGQRSSPRRDISALIHLVEDCRGAVGRFGVVSVDIPTGIDADTGQTFSPHVTADLTICVEHIKRGLLQFPARLVCGAIETVSIGLGRALETDFRILEQQNLPLLGARRADAHKGDFGRIGVIGGSVGMPGAPLLTALGALHAGAGLVSRVVKRRWSDSSGLPECMMSVLSRDGDCFTGEDAQEVVELLGGFDVIVIGPGMSLAPATEDFLAQVCDGLRLLGKRAVIDADAINLLSRVGISLTGIDAVITPHPGEASRLLGRPTPAIQANRFQAVRELWERYEVVSVLKGAGTLVYGPQGGKIVCRGTPYLATAGSGDVLAGIIAACCARFEDTFDAACLGAWVHAVAGILASERRGGPVLASDVAREASAVIGDLER
jgi:NAD(P)H-hydrate epimerase